MLPTRMCVTPTVNVPEGVQLIQLRCKGISAREYYGLALEMRALTRRSGCLLLINERLDIALAVEADGVHYPEEGLPALRMQNLLVGVSTHSIAAVERAEREGADYIIFGPIFSKTQQGLDNLQKAVEATRLPVYAIGGIDEERAALCLQRGAYGVAMQSFYLRHCEHARGS